MPRLTALLGALFLAGAALVLPAPAVQAAAGHQVLMSGYAFSPRTLTITAGDTVTWTNQDQAPHDVETTSGPASVHSPMLNKGGSWSHTFTTPGTYGYLCTVHPGMTARLVVEPAAAPAPTVHQHQHPTAAAPATRSAGAMPSSMHKGHSAEAAAPGSARTPSPSPTAATSAPAVAQPAVDEAASASRPLSPLLLLTGVVAGVAVLCLLLVGSRSAAAASRNEGPGTS
ncbi:plastocyanin/azurin family copper-binding protein [Streptomyces sp. NPDC001137]|uniref:cupredoxin domain-containing protein n=1 Tax=Streptomyces sp. NPDC001137 TaxID=3154378 RepID=UPI0033259C1A